MVSDEGYDGLVIKVKSQRGPYGVSSRAAKVKNSEIYAEAGVKLDDLVKLTAKNNLTGLEWAAGIPGTIGGALYGNAAAFEGSMSDIVEEVECIEPPKIRIFKNKDCQLSYKDSIFKKNKNLIILSCTLQLKPGNKKEIKQKIKYFLDYREKNHPLKFPSAGSIFKNPRNISAGELIEKCGLKRKKKGGAMISEKHANFIVNLKEAQAKDVLSLINLIKKEVKKKFNVELEEEIQYLKT